MRAEIVYWWDECEQAGLRRVFWENGPGNCAQCAKDGIVLAKMLEGVTTLSA
jgi:hypothetical protein